MANIVYMLLTGLWVFEDEETEEAKVQELVKGGRRPHVPSAILESNDPIIQVLVQAMHMCHVHDPKERASARRVETLLKQKLLEIDPNALGNIPGLE